MESLKLTRCVGKNTFVVKLLMITVAIVIFKNITSFGWIKPTIKKFFTHNTVLNLVVIHCYKHTENTQSKKKNPLDYILCHQIVDLQNVGFIPFSIVTI